MSAARASLACAIWARTGSWPVPPAVVRRSTTLSMSVASKAPSSKRSLNCLSSSSVRSWSFLPAFSHDSTMWPMTEWASRKGMPLPTR